MLDSDEEITSPNASTASSNPPPSSYSPPSQRPRRRSILSRSLPRSVHSPTNPKSPTSPFSSIPPAPASPPTPAPSPPPKEKERCPDWSTVDEGEEDWMKSIRQTFHGASVPQRERLLTELLNMCNSRQLNFVHDYVSPRLKKDPFTSLPNELCLRILSLVDHPNTLARSSQVSRRWHELVNDDMAWKILCERHSYRSEDHDSDDAMTNDIPQRQQQYPRLQQNELSYTTPTRPSAFSLPGSSSSAPDLTRASATPSPSDPNSPRNTSYRSHFKRKYMVATAWRSGGRVHARHITPDQGVVTSLHLTDKYIVVALDNAKIHVFDADGAHQKTLHGHIMGVWAMIPWDDILVSGGCDRDVRVWNMATGQNLHTLRGHSSTVRCLKMSDANTAITGSRDTTLRIWDVKNGYCKYVLVGHQASVRCVAVHNGIIASGSYDTTARLWRISDGRCFRILQGHFSQIYAIAYTGKRIATGSLDTSIRIWDPADGKCLAVLQGHTSLVGQIQIRGDTLVTGGSDGSVRVWSLERLVPIHRLAAHDNSVTSLQFDESRIVSGGSDGRVKIWDIKTGALVRELSQPADAVWRVVFEEEKAVILANRAQRTIMEVWSFSPPVEGQTAVERSGEKPVAVSNLHQKALDRYNNLFSRGDTSDDVAMSGTSTAPRPYGAGRRGILPRPSSTSQ
ncbi:MAG: hypothetical protein M1828_006751 [Chrysothrix sp. TS-e1954]|nr:MAG: hypothetical protein M1828_006751 [Chrysothrix sp. TS-e1954]